MEQKTKISAEVVADSKDSRGNRITSIICTFPRFILAELNTHRMFSRNSASSRAIPFKKMLKLVQEDPFIPIAWQKDHPGMQGTEYFTEEDGKVELVSGEFHTTLKELHKNQLIARDWAVKLATIQNNLGATKQLCNRLLEPFMWHKVLITATEWSNFFELRCPQYEIDGRVYKSKKDASTTSKGETNILGKASDEYWRSVNKGQSEIHMMALAEAIWDAMNDSTPIKLKDGEWHIPFGDKMDLSIDLVKDEQAISTGFIQTLEDLKIKIATARCARLSYQTLGDNAKIDYEADIKLHDILLKSGHFSPFEHCAKVMNNPEYYEHVRGIGSPEREDFNGFGWSYNFKGFIQYRELISNPE